MANKVKRTPANIVDKPIDMTKVSVYLKNTCKFAVDDLVKAWSHLNDDGKRPDVIIPDEITEAIWYTYVKYHFLGWGYLPGDTMRYIRHAWREAVKMYRK
jgi:hypothetical protein